MEGKQAFILKLGGDVVLDQKAMQTMVDVVRRHRARGHDVVLVASAPRGATNYLRDRIKTGDENDQIEAENRYSALMRRWMEAMGVKEDKQTDMLSSILLRFNGGKAGSSPPSPDQILALGEMNTVEVLELFFLAQGLPACFVKVWESGMLTDRQFGAAHPLPGARDLLHSSILPVLDNGQVAIVPGFVGHTEDGQITTLGRSGSDLTATFVAWALGAQTVEVWKKDVLHTADPRIFTHALPVLFLSLDQAAELAAHGMAALHPAAMEPLRGTKAVVYVKSVGAPHLKGTRISSGGGGSRCAGITLSPDHVLYTARTGAMVDAIGSLRAASSALNEMGYPVGLTASGQTSFTLSASVANMETAAVQERILDRCGGETEVTFRIGCTILTIVGGNRGITPRILASITAALARARIPVISISMAASLRLDSYPTSCQVVVADRRGKNALSVVHVALYGKPPKRTRKRKS